MSDKTLIQWTDALKERFWGYVAIGAPDECWLWKAGVFSNGYGQFRVGEKKVKAHRVAFEITFGRSVGFGLIVCHSCDNPPCCNPAHLSEGTHATQDREHKRRGARNLLVKRGEENGAAKLCAGEVLEIRALVQSGKTLRGAAWQI